MKLVLLHGLAIEASRQKLLSLKSKFSSSNTLQSSNVSEILASLMTMPLIAEERAIILENPADDLPLNKLSDAMDLTLIFWFDKELSEKSAILNFVKNKGEVLYFPLEKESSIFPFLDLLASKNPKAFLELKKLQTTHEKFSDMQYLITMIFYLLRSLAVTPKNAPPFVKQKLEKQRKNFTSQDIKNLYRFIIESDFKIKSGFLDNTHAEFLVVNKFLN